MAFLHLDKNQFGKRFYAKWRMVPLKHWVHFITYTITVEPTAWERLCVIIQFIAQTSDSHVLQKKKRTVLYLCWCGGWFITACSQFSLTKISFEPCRGNFIYLFICAFLLFFSACIGKRIVLSSPLFSRSFLTWNATV